VLGNIYLDFAPSYTVLGADLNGNNGFTGFISDLKIYPYTLSFISKYLYQYYDPKPITKININNNNQSSNRNLLKKTKIDKL